MTEKRKVLIRKPKKERPIRVLLTAGPTRAYLDSVRYLSNYSTGELGFCVSRALIRRGIEVVAVVGPTHQPFSKLGFKKLIMVETADEMAKATLKLCRSFKPDFAIFAAAVLDFKPARRQSGKVSSSLGIWRLDFVPTPKIIDQVGALYPRIKRIGFKLEWTPKTGKGLSVFAQDLLNRKNLDAVCINFLSQIKKQNHPVWIFNKANKPRKCLTKLETAKVLAELVSRPVESSS